MSATEVYIFIDQWWQHEIFQLHVCNYIPEIWKLPEGLHVNFEEFTDE